MPVMKANESKKCQILNAKKDISPPPAAINPPTIVIRLQEYLLRRYIKISSKQCKICSLILNHIYDEFWIPNITNTSQEIQTDNHIHRLKLQQAALITTVLIKKLNQQYQTLFLLHWSILEFPKTWCQMKMKFLQTLKVDETVENWSLLFKDLFQ